MTLTLHDYFRSSASYRVRIALNLKGLEYARVFVHLRRDGGQHRSPEFLALNPQGLVPLLVTATSRISQSVAIMEYLDETYPEPALLPAERERRAYVRQIVGLVACDVHPLNNLRVLEYLAAPLEVSAGAVRDWNWHWLRLGLDALESMVSSSPWRGRFCCGDSPTMADCVVVPQLSNAARVAFDLSPYPTLRGIRDECESLDAFRRAAPARQPDAE